jgi:hypothetical protein
MSPSNRIRAFWVVLATLAAVYTATISGSALASEASQKEISLPDTGGIEKIVVPALILSFAKGAMDRLKE